MADTREIARKAGMLVHYLHKQARRRGWNGMEALCHHKRGLTDVPADSKGLHRVLASAGWNDVTCVDCLKFSGLPTKTQYGVKFIGPDLVDQVYTFDDEDAADAYATEYKERFVPGAERVERFTRTAIELYSEWI